MPSIREPKVPYAIREMGTPPFECCRNLRNTHHPMYTVAHSPYNKHCRTRGPEENTCSVQQSACTCTRHLSNAINLSEKHTLFPPQHSDCPLHVSPVLLHSPLHVLVLKSVPPNISRHFSFPQHTECWVHVVPVGTQQWSTLRSLGLQEGTRGFPSTWTCTIGM